MPRRSVTTTSGVWATGSATARNRIAVSHASGGLDATVVVGNHDWAAIGGMDVDEFNPEARRAVLWTQAHLSPLSSGVVAGVAGRAARGGRFYADPRKSAAIRSGSTSCVRPTRLRSSSGFDPSVCLVGHTHVPALYIRHASDGKMERQVRTFGKAIPLQADTRAIRTRAVWGNRATTITGRPMRSSTPSG